MILMSVVMLSRLQRIKWNKLLTIYDEYRKLLLIERGVEPSMNVKMKYKITPETIGDLGSWVEEEENLSQEGDCWVYGKAMVFDNEMAQVFDKAIVSDGIAKVYGDAAMISGGKITNKNQ